MEYADPDGPPVDAFLRRGKRSHCHVTFDPLHCCSIDRSSSHLEDLSLLKADITCSDISFSDSFIYFFVACKLYLRTTVSFFCFLVVPYFDLTF